MFTMQLAEHTFNIDNKYIYTEKMCQRYLTDDIAEVTISVTDEEIIKEDILNKSYPNDYLESLAIYRKVCEYLISKDIVLFHGSCIAVDNMAYLFTAKSGTGKSTHTKLWREYFKNRAIMVNDDKPLIRISNDIMVYGTAWSGKHHLDNNISVPLKAICILERDNFNHIEKVGKKEVYPIFLQQIYRPKDIPKMMKTLSLLDILTNKVELYRLGCNISQEAVLTAYNTMKI